MTDPTAAPRPSSADRWRTRWTAGLRVLAIVLVVLVLLPQGSVRVLPTAAFTVAMAGLGAIAVLSFGEARRTRALHRIALTALVLLTGWIALQATALPGLPWVNPIWDTAGGLVGALPPRISVQPAETVSATVYLALPILTFMVLLTLFPDDEAALSLIRALGWMGAGIAAVSIVQFEAFPDTLLLGPKTAYLDSLTATFVNRNTAATFLGLTALALVVPVMVDLRQLKPGDIVRWLTTTHRRVRPAVGWRLPVGLVLLAVTLAALFLTRSRGGVGSTLAAFAVVGPLLAAFTVGREDPRSLYRRTRPSGIGRTVRAVGGLLLVLTVALVFAERAAFRAAVQGTEDGRFCVLPGIMALIRSNWPVGTGFGTFRDAFGAYRDPACGLYGVWDRAHNVYLEGLAGLGLPGGIATVTVTLVLIVTFGIGAKNRRSLRAAPLVGFGMVLLLILHSAIDFSLQLPGLSVWAAALMAPLVTISLGRTSQGTKRTDRFKFEETAQPG